MSHFSTWRQASSVAFIIMVTRVKAVALSWFPCIRHQEQDRNRTIHCFGQCNCLLKCKGCMLSADIYLVQFGVCVIHAYSHTGICVIWLYCHVQMKLSQITIVLIEREPPPTLPFNKPVYCSVRTMQDYVVSGLLLWLQIHFYAC